MALDKTAFDLFAGLSALSKGDLTWYDKLTPEGQKAAAPYVMMRWMTGTSDMAQIIRLNTMVNPYVFSGSSDKSALFKSLAAAATGRTSRYAWVKGPGAKTKKSSIEVIKQYYDCSTREAVTYTVANDDLLTMAEELGWDKDEIAKLKKEFDDGTGPTTKVSSKPKKSTRAK
jgi:hypothetical protein